MGELKITRTQAPKAKVEDESKLGFGKLFTDHMFIMDYDRGQGWHEARIVPYADFVLDPAALVFHYAQALFEGLKAYKNEKGEVLLFRPRDNFLRMNRTAERLCVPTIDVDEAVENLKTLIDIERGWIPSSPGTSLYIRPTIIATEPVLGVKASDKYIFFIILSPVGAYYAEGMKPTRIYVENEYVRAVPGGTGHTKAGANYAASLIAGEKAHEKGYSQVLWLDGVKHANVEEVGSMNMFFVIDGELITPALSGSILPGITRDSIIQIARSMGLKVTERTISIEEIFAAHDNGKLDEAFGTGTAAVVSAVGEMTWDGRTITISNGEIGKYAQMLYDKLTGIQLGREADPFNWVVRV
ncbi:MAG: branched-chain amino acid aminotransferase [Bacillota bacterium]